MSTSAVDNCCAKSSAHFSKAVECFEKKLEVSDWGRTMRVVIYRRRVRHEAPKNYQLDLFDPADGHYEYSAVVTNKDLTGVYLWYFQCGRGSHEKAYAELKDGFAFDCLPSRRYAAHSAWQMLSVLAFSLMRSMQVATTATRRTPALKGVPQSAECPGHGVVYVLALIRL